MRSLWTKIDAGLERWLISICYAYFCLIILIEVVRRYFFGASSPWGEMTARYAFVFLVYFAVAEVARTRDHIAGLVIFYSLTVVGLSVSNNTLMTGFDLNVAFAQAALPLGWALLAYRVVQRFLRTLESYRKRGEVPLGGGGFGE